MLDEEGFEPGLGEVRAGLVGPFDGEVDYDGCTCHCDDVWDGCVAYMMDVMHLIYVKGTLCASSCNGVVSDF